MISRSATRCEISEINMDQFKIRKRNLETDVGVREGGTVVIRRVKGEVKRA